MSKLLVAKRFLLFGLGWLVLSRGDAAGLAIGVAAAAAATWASAVLLPPRGRGVNLFALVRLVPGFIVRSLRGGVDVGWRALHPRMPLDAGWIGYRTRLEAGLPQVSLGSEVSLLPGSLVAGGRGGLLYVHCLDRGQQVRRSLLAEELRIAAVWPGNATPEDPS